MLRSRRLQSRKGPFPLQFRATGDSRPEVCSEGGFLGGKGLPPPPRAGGVYTGRVMGAGTLEFALILEPTLSNQGAAEAGGLAPPQRHRLLQPQWLGVTC